MITWQDDELNTCGFQQMNYVIRILISLIAALLAVLTVFFKLIGDHDSPIKFAEYHMKLAALFLLVCVMDFRSVYIGWDACQNGMLWGNIDLMDDIGECVYWPFMPFIVMDIILGILQWIVAKIAGKLNKLLIEKVQQKALEMMQLYQNYAENIPRFAVSN